MYGKAALALYNADLDLGAGSYKAALVSASYTVDPDADQFFSTPEANEVTGTNWAAGGVAVTLTVSQVTASNRIKLAISDISVATVTLTGGKHIVIYKVLGGASSADPLVAYGTFDTALAPTAGTLAIDFDDTNGGIYSTYGV